MCRASGVCVNWHTWRLRGVSCVRCVCELAYLEAVRCVCVCELAYLEAERCVMCEVCV